MRVAVVGTRGIPGVHGGVERHCAEIYPRLVALGVDVTVYARSSYVGDVREWRGVQVVPLDAPGGKSTEAIVHTAKALLAARRLRPDIVHIHSIGPASLTGFARLLGMPTVVTVHAPDYLQAKWGRLARAYLRFGERTGVRRSDRVIGVSRALVSMLQAKYGREVTYIPNGPAEGEIVAPGPVLEELGLEAGGYVLFVGRLIPDKRVEDVAAACTQEPTLPLVVVGNSSHTDEYTRGLMAAYPKVVFAGYRHGAELAELYSNAAVFALPSAVEGLPLSLLEAMSYGLPCVAADIPATREIVAEVSPEVLVPVGDAAALRKRIDDWLRLETGERVALGKRLSDHVRAMYDWDRIARETLAVYSEVFDCRSKQ